MPADTLLLGGGRSPAYLKAALDALERAIRRPGGSSSRAWTTAAPATPTWAAGRSGWRRTTPLLHLTNQAHTIPNVSAAANVGALALIGAGRIGAGPRTDH